MSLRILVNYIHDVQEEDHRPKCHETPSHKDMRVVAIPPRQNSDDTSWVQEHEERGDGTHHSDHILDAGRKGGDDGGDQEPKSDGWDSELFVAGSERGGGSSGHLHHEAFESGAT